MSEKLLVNPIECEGARGVRRTAARDDPSGRVGLPDRGRATGPAALERDARAAVSACPTLALRLLRS